MEFYLSKTGPIRYTHGLPGFLWTGRGRPHAVYVGQCHTNPKFSCCFPAVRQIGMLSLAGRKKRCDTDFR